MSRKVTTHKTPRKAELFQALRLFTDAVKAAGGIHLREGGKARRRRPTLDAAYLHACKLLGEQPETITTETTDDYEAQAAYLIGKYQHLVDLAERRGYSGRALAGLVLSAAQAEIVKAV